MPRASDPTSDTITITVRITKEKHARIQSAFKVRERYRNRIAYFVQDAINAELQGVENEKKKQAPQPEAGGF